MKLVKSLILTILTNIHLLAGGTGENVLLVVNADSQDSKTIANHYAQLRQIPREQIVYLSGINPTTTTITSHQLRELILQPIYKHLNESKQDAHIDYIIYSSGFPFNIKCIADAEEGKKYSNTQTPILSLTSATFYAEMILDKNMDYMQSGANPLYNIQDTPKGFRSAPNSDNKRHRLSFLLGNLAPTSSSLDQVLTYLKTAKDADFTQPNGTFYFTETADVRSKTRLSQFTPIIEKLIKLGHQAQLIKTNLPREQLDILGATMGTRTFNWPNINSKFMPGAIADNLTSYGGILTGKGGQTPCTQFLNHGAAASCGTVVEPYAIAAKFPQASIHLHYAQGSNAAEAMYASVKDPYQLIMVGDPLCQPFAKDFTIEVTAKLITTNGTKKIAYTPKTNRPAAHHEVFIDGVFKEKVKDKFLLGSNDLGPGAHEIRIVAVADDPLETRASYTKTIFLMKDMPKIKITTNKTSIKTGETLTVKIASQNLPEVSLYQNTQLLGKTKNGTIQIKAETLGAGKIELYGRVELNGKIIRTAKIEIEVIKAIVPKTEEIPLTPMP